VHRDGERHVERQLPVVDGVRPQLRDVDVFREVLRVDRVVLVGGLVRVVLGLEVVGHERPLEVHVEHPVDRLLVEALDELADVRMEVVVERVVELRVVPVALDVAADLHRRVRVVEAVLGHDLRHRTTVLALSASPPAGEIRRSP
jgi:hypothetical protein